jgi:hypothetical protein
MLALTTVLDVHSSSGSGGTPAAAFAPQQARIVGRRTAQRMVAAEDFMAAHAVIGNSSGWKLATVVGSP